MILSAPIADLSYFLAIRSSWTHFLCWKTPSLRILVGHRPCLLRLFLVVETLTSLVLWPLPDQPCSVSLTLALVPPPLHTPCPPLPSCLGNLFSLQSSGWVSLLQRNLLWLRGLGQILCCKPLRDGSFLWESCIPVLVTGNPFGCPRQVGHWICRQKSAALQGPHGLPGGHGQHHGMSAGTVLKTPPAKRPGGRGMRNRLLQDHRPAAWRQWCLNQVLKESGRVGSPSRQKECAYPRPESEKALSLADQWNAEHAGATWAEDEEGRGVRRKTRDKPGKVGWVRLRGSSGAPMSHKELSKYLILTTVWRTDRKDWGTGR